MLLQQQIKTHFNLLVCGFQFEVVYERVDQLSGASVLFVNSSSQFAIHFNLMKYCGRGSNKLLNHNLHFKPNRA